MKVERDDVFDFKVHFEPIEFATLKLMSDNSGKSIEVVLGQVFGTVIDIIVDCISGK